MNATPGRRASSAGRLEFQSGSIAVPRSAAAVGTAVPRPKSNLFQQVRRRIHQAEVVLRQTLGLAQSEQRLARDAQAYWSDTDNAIVPEYAHWRGAGVFADEQRWLAIGAAQIALFDRLAPAAGLPRHFDRVIEWGCGGGANAVHFMPRARTLVGVDIAPATLGECARQMEGLGRAADFQPVQIDVARPEMVLDKVAPSSCDLFYSLHVFELLPGTDYVHRLLRLAHVLLRDGGAAFIQLRFDRGAVRTAARRWSYANNLTSTANMRAEAFWDAALAAGLAPQAAYFLPFQAINNQTNYLYVLMTKPGEEPAPSPATSPCPHTDPAVPPTAPHRVSTA
jgi:hypothetical protein